MVLVSAHRGGAGDDVPGENTADAFSAAIAAGVDYVEFDVVISVEGRAEVAHQRPASGTRALDLDDLLEIVAGRVGAHVDLKMADGHDPAGADLEVVERIVGRLGSERVVITSAEDSSVRRIVAWSLSHAPGLPVGLSTSKPQPKPWLAGRVRSWVVQWFPRTRLRRCGATVVASHHLWARWWLRSWARRHDLPLLVWTVDETAELERWLRDEQTWILTTNHPLRALALRDRA